MKVEQKEIQLQPFTKGFHLITPIIEECMSEISQTKTGYVQAFIKHTSASLTINENADPTVREDFESHLDVMVPEGAPYYKHIYEGVDDMPAHIKSSLLGTSIQIPITHGRLNLGTWQGIYLGEHRNSGGVRKIVITVIGE